MNTDTDTTTTGIRAEETLALLEVCEGSQTLAPSVKSVRSLDELEMLAVGGGTGNLYF